MWVTASALKLKQQLVNIEANILWMNFVLQTFWGQLWNSFNTICTLYCRLRVKSGEWGEKEVDSSKTIKNIFHSSDLLLSPCSDPVFSSGGSPRPSAMWRLWQLWRGLDPPGREGPSDTRGGLRDRRGLPALPPAAWWQPAPPAAQRVWQRRISLQPAAGGRATGAFR